jgi:hypothetical protein
MTGKIAQTGLMRGFVVVALVTAVALPAGGGAVAAVHGGGPQAVVVAPGTISTVAGGVGGPAKGTKVAVNGACGVSPGLGGVLVGDGPVEQMSARTGRLTPLTSTGTGGHFSGGGLAASTPVDACGTAVDHSGNVVIADGAYHRIVVLARRTGRFYRRAMTAGHVYTVAGTGADGSSGDGGPATKAEFGLPGSVAVDAAGNLVIGDPYSGRVRVVAVKMGTFYGQPMTAGNIYTVAQSVEAVGVAVDAAGNVLIADPGHSQVKVVAASTGTFYGQPMTAGGLYTIAGTGTLGFTGDGGPATAAKLNGPSGVAVDAAGNVLIADAGNYRVRVIAESTGTFYGQPMTAGDIYKIAGNGGKTTSGDGGPATTASLGSPEGVAVDAAGNLLIAVDGFPSPGVGVRVVAASTGTFYGQPMTAGDIYSIAGNGKFESGIGGSATSAVLGARNDSIYGHVLFDLTTDRAGDTLITKDNRILAMAARTGTLYGRAVTAGHIYYIAGNGKRGFSGDGGPALQASLSTPADMTTDAAGNLLICDARNSRVRVVAASTGTFYGQPMTAGDIYTIAGNGTAGSAGDGGLATAAEFDGPAGVTVDGSGNVVIADSGNSRIQVVAESTGTFYHQAMTTGHVYTVADNSNPRAHGHPGSLIFNGLYPADVRVDAAGNLVFLSRLHFVRVVAESTGTFYGQHMKTGHVYVVAGKDSDSSTRSGVPAGEARLNPAGLAIDATGNLVISNYQDNQLDVVADATGTFYGVPMTAGDLYIVAGYGRRHRGFWGDGGPSTKAALDQPTGVTIDAAGNLLFADSDNNRIREIAG